PTLYASGREGWAVRDLDTDERKDILPLFETILSHVPAPQVDEKAPFSMLVTTLENASFMGRVLTGKILSGTLKVNTMMKALSREGGVIETARVSKIMAFRGLERTALEEAHAGDIVSIAGFSKATVADTICAQEVTTPIESMPIDPPTLAMTFSINTSPFAGKEGTKVTSRMIWERLLHEVEGNVALKVSKTDSTDAFEVAGRGELQLGILIETMRREGFELSISRPRVLFQTDENGNKTEPYEEVVVDVDEDYSGVVVNKMAERKGELTEMAPTGGKKTRLTFIAPSRGLIGYHSEFLTDTCGTGIMNRIFHSYGPYKGQIQARRNGVLISTETGKAVAYALFKIQERGPLFVEHNTPVYAGMIIGGNAKSGDIEVNPIKGKQLTNMRAAGKDDNVILTPPVRMSLEEALVYINDDELVEVTPENIRLRKKFLDSNDRRKAERGKL
ncbi:MAG: translational GTPase TypA, partial [Alphaproteobacteria bacterium]|nr:translational GTPase TypA [Alphaproteobacteria bacterium]